MAAAAAALVLAASAGASGVQGITKHDRDVIRFFEHHPRLAATPAGGRALAHLLPRVVTEIRSLQAAKAADAIPAGICASCWDAVASCESGGNWSEVTGNGFYWGLQWVPSTWDSTAARHGLPSFDYFASHRLAPSRAQQIVAASDMSLSNWPVCGARY